MEGDFDVQRGHRFFSAGCFNKTWAFLDEKDRSAAANERMIQCAHASMWHWLERSDLDAGKRSVGWWLLSRVYAVAGLGERALHYGGLSLEEAEGGNLAPFYLAYACEGIARAYQVIGEPHELTRWRERAKKETFRVSDPESRALLEADLATL